MAQFKTTQDYVGFKIKQSSIGTVVHQYVDEDGIKKVIVDFGDHEEDVCVDDFSSIDLDRGEILVTYQVVA
jgi:hypothetical protein